MNPPNAFTLIELLVVVTIIVVLPALLAPAMDQAIYQAELTVCGSKLHVIGATVTTYAFENKMRYPFRPQFLEPDVGWQAALLYNGDPALNAAILGNPSSKTYDDREVLRPLFDLNTTLLDPLTKKIDLEDMAVNCFGYSTYSLWFGWQFRTPDVYRGMFKVGDRFGFDAKDGGGTMVFDVLASDADGTNRLNGQQSQSSHPDRANLAQNVVRQNTTFWASVYPATMVMSFWRYMDGRRGENDLNYAHADGSVRRYNGVKYRDERMRFVPQGSQDQRAVTDTWAESLPPL